MFYFFFTFFVFLYIIMYIQDIASTIEKMSVKEVRDFIFANYYKRIGFSQENSYYSVKRLKKKKI